MSVFVLNMRDEPLMPCSPAKARILLKEDKAVVVRRIPFAIKLKIATGETRQPVTVGVDPGFENLGLCASSEKRVLYASETKLRTDIPKLLATRRELRRGRRYRKTRYRRPTGLFNTLPEGWLAPSIQNKLDTTMRQLFNLAQMMPVTKVNVEVASFDIQKIKNPDIQGAEYQQGEQLGFWNVREYVLHRDGHQCQHCKGKSGDKVLNVHHLESRQTGGDAPNNLITLCETCHKAFHAGKIELKQKRGASFRPEAFMTMVRWKLVNNLKAAFPDAEVQHTYGYLTKNSRIACGLAKTHYADAFCIAGNMDAKLSEDWLFQVQKRRHNRQIHKTNFRKGGIRPLNQNGYETFGFRLFDKVRTLDGQIGFIFGKRTSGSFDVRTLDGTRISAGLSYKKLALLEKRKTILSELKHSAFPPRPEGRGRDALEVR